MHVNVNCVNKVTENKRKIEIQFWDDFECLFLSFFYFVVVRKSRESEFISFDNLNCCSWASVSNVNVKMKILWFCIEIRIRWRCNLSFFFVIFTWFHVEIFLDFSTISWRTKIPLFFTKWEKPTEILMIRKMNLTRWLLKLD